MLERTEHNPSARAILMMTLGPRYHMHPTWKFLTAWTMISFLKEKKRYQVSVKYHLDAKRASRCLRNSKVIEHHCKVGHTIRLMALEALTFWRRS